ncbi:hypothetical protein PCE1_001424 [Barthelona sp. PCE]
MSYTKQIKKDWDRFTSYLDKKEELHDCAVLGYDGVTYAGDISIKPSDTGKLHAAFNSSSDLHLCVNGEDQQYFLVDNHIKPRSKRGVIAYNRDLSKREAIYMTKNHKTILLAPFYLKDDYIENELLKVQVRSEADRVSEYFYQMGL